MLAATSLLEKKKECLFGSTHFGFSKEILQWFFIQKRFFCRILCTRRQGDVMVSDFVFTRIIQATRSNSSSSSSFRIAFAVAAGGFGSRLHSAAVHVLKCNVARHGEEEAGHGQHLRERVRVGGQGLESGAGIAQEMDHCCPEKHPACKLRPQHKKRMVPAEKIRR